MADENATEPAVTTPAEDSEFAAAVVQKATTLALSIDDKATIAEKLKDFIAETFPERVSTAYWVVLTQHKDRDKGVAIEICKLPASLHAKALAGGWSAGLGVFSDDFDLSKLHAKASIGAGAVIRYSDPSHLLPFVGVTVRF